MTEHAHQPVVSLRGRKVVQIGIVVRDAVRTARRYAELLGIGPWEISDIVPTETLLRGRLLGDVESGLRIAAASFGSLQIELLQPLYGPSSHLEFLREHGPGIHHLSFGPVADHDALVAALAEHGIGIEMQGGIGGTTRFTYLGARHALGTLVELVRSTAPGVPARAASWGSYVPPGPGVVSTRDKQIVQVGIVVEDAERAARSYWELLGIGPWTLIDFEPPHVAAGVFHGIPMRDVHVHVRAALADHEGLQLELLQPVAGPGTHRDFLKAHGPGAHHVSFGVVADHDEVVAALGAQGIGVEMAGELGGASTFTYLATQDELGTIFELVKLHPGAETTLRPYGTIPTA